MIDHHQVGGALPEDTPVANPNREDDLSGLGYLCAAGVVFMVLLFSYFYTSIIFNSVDVAENLKKQGVTALDFEEEIELIAEEDAESALRAAAKMDSEGNKAAMDLIAMAKIM